MWSLTKTRQENNVVDRTSVVYIEKIVQSIGLGVVNDEIDIE